MVKGKSKAITQISRRALASLLILIGLAITPALAFYAVMRNLDAWSLKTPIKILLQEPLPQRSTILASDGSLIATFFGENRIIVNGNDIPAKLKQALIATEDTRFNKHNGVDWIATGHALVSQFLGGGVRGGSGITQQYVKNLLISHAQTQAERDAAVSLTIDRKIREAFLAMKVETILTKDQILTEYFNTVFFGDGSYGIGAAARHYFNKTLNELTLAESALLVGIVQNPSSLNPVADEKAALVRRAHVLSRMFQVGFITKEQEIVALNEPIILHLTTTANGCTTSAYPFYCQWIRQTLSNDPTFGATPELRQQFLYRGGLTIRTSLDTRIQKGADKIARAALDPKSNVAVGMAIVEPGTGHVVAISTNEGWGSGAGQTQLILPVLPSFQPGSTFKPITVITAIEQGVNPDIALFAGSTFTPAKRNAPVGGFHNAEPAEGGYFNMATALKFSVNTWFVTLEDRIGVKIIAQTGAKMGMTSLPLTGPRAITEKDATLTLGVYETSPLQLASVYATIAAHGLSCNPIGILSIASVSGQSVSVPSPDCRQVIRASTANTVTSMMEGVIKGGTGTNANIPGRPVAGKTGTTTSATAAWFAGFTPQYATAVWIGDPRGGYAHPMRNLRAYGAVWEPVWGGGIPALIWKNTMTMAHQGLPIMAFAPTGGDTYVGSPLLVPDVRGMTLNEAQQILTSSGFTVSVGLKGSSMEGIQSGRVSSTTPSMGSPIPMDRAKSIILHATP
jgi:membrane peptidoglycan carboxypeptidase